MVSNRYSLVLRGTDAFLALNDYPASYVIIKSPYGVDVLFQWPFFAIELVKTQNWIFKLAETDLGRWTLVETVISADAYIFQAFLYLTCTFKIQEYLFTGYLTTCGRKKFKF